MKERTRQNWLAELENPYGGITKRSEVFDNITARNFYIWSHVATWGDDERLREVYTRELKHWGLKATDVMEWYESLENDLVVGESGEIYVNEKIPDENLGMTDKLKYE